VIEPLRVILDRYRAERERGDQFGLMTLDSRMFRFTLQHIGRKKVGDAFSRAGLSFAGFHAFRRGLAGNLFELGADDLTVQRILRHGSVQVTQEHYIKIRNPKVDKAMETLAKAYRKRPRKGLESAPQKPKVIEKK
jgi:integrase